MSSPVQLEWTEQRVRVGGDELAVLSAGSGTPLLLLHEELGFPGPLQWQAAMARERRLIAPQHPGFGRGPAMEWLAGIRDLACVYGRYLREQHGAPIDVIGFSFGGWLAAEMAANDPRLFSRMVLVSPFGIKPERGEILDMFMLTAAQYLRATVRDVDATEEFRFLYGAEQTPEMYAAFEDARAQVARLAWKPYLYNPSLPHLLEGLAGVPTLVIGGRDDGVTPPEIAERYAALLGDARLVLLDTCGHRPEIEQRERFLDELQRFLA